MLYHSEYLSQNDFSKTSFSSKQKAKHLDDCIQNFHLGRYIVGYTVGNLVFRRRASRAVKRDFQTYIRQHTSPNQCFECGYPNFNVGYFYLKRCKMHKAAHHSTDCDVINDVKLFPTVCFILYVPSTSFQL